MDQEKKQINNTDNLKNIHTYSSDVSDAVRNNETSVIKIALAEKNKKERDEIYKEMKGTNTSKFFLMIGGIIIILIACVGIYLGIQKRNIQNTPIQINNEDRAIITYDEKSYLNLTDSINEKDIINLLKVEVNKTESSGIIKSVFLTKIENGSAINLSLNDLLSLLKLSIPNSMIRSFSGTYMIGSYIEQGTDPNPTQKHLFIIFGINDYNSAYASMLEWENSLLIDMFNIFNIDVSNRIEILRKSWEDIIINNKDARVLYSPDGKAILYYIFVDKNNLVITDSKEAIREISARLLTQNTRPL